MPDETRKKTPFWRQISDFCFKGLPAQQRGVDLGIHGGQPFLGLALGLGRLLVEGRIGQPALQCSLLDFQCGDARGQLFEFALLLETEFLAFDRLYLCRVASADF